MPRLLSAALLAFSLTLAHSVPADADARRAAEFFALAEAAEKRSDWQVAIQNYERAYNESPHPDTLFNIALNYERLGRLRDAARYLERFAGETDDPKERGRAEEKRKEFHQRPAKVTFTSDPSGGAIVLDGEAIGVTPLEQTVEAGEHSAVLVVNDSKSQPRALIVEYGEPISIDFRLGTKPGRLTVTCNVPGAEIMIDGVPRGETPFSDYLPAGKHTVLVSAAGYRTVSRDIDVPAEGSEQISAQLTAVFGTKPAGTPELGPIGYLAGFGFGASSETDAETSLRTVFELGVRTRTQRWDFVGTYGNYGGKVGSGVGVGLRAYLAGRSFRPYVRAALLYGRVEEFDGGRAGSLAGEGGVGLRYLGPSTPRSFAVEYFAEINFQVASSSAQIDDPVVQDPTLIAPVSAISLSFPVTLGIAIRFGARK